MSAVTSGSGASTRVDAAVAPATQRPVAVDQLADSVDWFDDCGRAWRRRGWTRRVACLAMFGAIGDALTTSLLPHIDGIHEGNPVSAAGQAAVGSVPLFMILVTIPLLLVFVILANRPRSGYTWFIWAAVASVGAVKLVVTCSNLLVLGQVAAL